MICIDCKSATAYDLGVKGEYNFIKCPKCDIIYSSPFWLYDYEKQYDNDYFYKQSVLNNHGDRIGKWNKDLKIAAERYERAMSYIIDKPDEEYRHLWLDIGGAFGAMIPVGKRYNYIAYVLESNRTMVRWARRFVHEPGDKYKLWHANFVKLDADKICDNIYDAYDVISLYDVFEHFANPIIEMKKISELLTQNGHIVIEQPDPSSEEAKRKGINWKHLRPLEHPFLFSKVNFERLFNRFGLNLIGFERHMQGRYFLIAQKQ